MNSPPTGTAAGDGGTNGTTSGQKATPAGDGTQTDPTDGMAPQREPERPRLIERPRPGLGLPDFNPFPLLGRRLRSLALPPLTSSLTSTQHPPTALRTTAQPSAGGTAPLQSRSAAGHDGAFAAGPIGDSSSMATRFSDYEHGINAAAAQAPAGLTLPASQVPTVSRSLPGTLVSQQVPSGLSASPVALPPGVPVTSAPCSPVSSAPDSLVTSTPGNPTSAAPIIPDIMAPASHINGVPMSPALSLPVPAAPASNFPVPRTLGVPAAPASSFPVPRILEVPAGAPASSFPVPRSLEVPAGTLASTLPVAAASSPSQPTVTLASKVSYS